MRKTLGLILSAVLISVSVMIFCGNSAFAFSHYYDASLLPNDPSLEDIYRIDKEIKERIYGLY